jgi:hypothetical protein
VVQVIWFVTAGCLWRWSPAGTRGRELCYGVNYRRGDRARGRGGAHEHHFIPLHQLPDEAPVRIGDVADFLHVIECLSERPSEDPH